MRGIQAASKVCAIVMVERSFDLSQFRGCFGQHLDFDGAHGMKPRVERDRGAMMFAIGR